MRIHSKGKKASSSRRLMKEMKWERKKWKTNVSVPRRPSVRSLGARGESSVPNSVNMAHADSDEEVLFSFSPLNSLASLGNSQSQYNPEGYVEAEGFHSSCETSQPDRGLSVHYEARGITREPQFQNNTGSRGSIMGQELDGETVHSADTEIAPSAQLLITDSGLGTFPAAVENVEDSQHIEVAQHSRGEVLDASRPALSHENLAQVGRETQAPFTDGAQAVANQGQNFVQQEVAEVHDITVGNHPHTNDVHIHNDGILRYQYHPLTRDIDLRAQRRHNWLTRLSYRGLQKCATCFQRPRQTLNLPCRCLCNCLDCDLVMSKCSMCQRPIRASVMCGLRR